MATFLVQTRFDVGTESAELWQVTLSVLRRTISRTTFSHMNNIAGIIYYICTLAIDIQCTRYKNAFNQRFLANCVSKQLR